MTPSEEQLIIANLFVSVIVFMATIPFFANLMTVYSNYRDGKNPNVVGGVIKSIFIHLLIVFFIFFFVNMWDLIVAESLPEYKLLGSSGLFAIFWADCVIPTGTTLIDSLNAYRCLFFIFFEFVVSLLLGMFPFIFFVMALFVISPREQGGKEKSLDIVKKIFMSMVYTFVFLVAIRFYIESLDVVIHYKGTESIYDMNHAFWKKLLIKD